MKSTLIALIIGLFGVATTIHANEAPATGDATSKEAHHKAKKEHHGKKEHHKKGAHPAETAPVEAPDA